MNYLKDARIDETALDVEILEQTNLAIRYGEYLTACKKKVALADEKVKYVRSELINKAHKYPDKYLGKGIKPTQLTVEAFFRTHPSHVEAKNELFEAQEELDNAEIAKNEIGFTRKNMLELLVQLYISNYFAGPKMPRNLTQERNNFKRNREETRQEANKRIRLRRS